MKKPVTTTDDKETKLAKYVKKNKPKFVRQESWRYKRLKENWRRPRGLDNKMRRKIKGWPPTVNTGYRGPKVSRGLHPSGYREVLVHNLKELKEIDPKTQVIRIAHKVGNRKKAKMLPEAKKKKIIILNVKKIKEFRKKEEAEEEIETEESEQKKTKGEQKNDGGS
jgi:large subunit ribosomal protein L32e